MAIRLKTVEYSFDSITASPGSNLPNLFAPITVFIPETTGRVFKSVFSEVFFKTGYVTATSACNYWSIDASIGTGSNFVSNSKTAAISMQRSSNIIFVQDFTGLFNSSTLTSSTSDSFQVRVTVSGVTAAWLSCKTYITYEYSDTNQNTYLKTVKIPIESTSSSISNVETELGTSQIPALDTFLPEGGKVYRDIFFEYYSVDHQVGSANIGQTLSAGSVVPDVTFSTTDGPAGVGNILYYNYKLYNSSSASNLATSASQSVKVTPNAASRVSNAGGILTVTYEYSLSSSTTALNSISIPLFDPTIVSSTNRDYPIERVRKFWLSDSGILSLRQSGILYTWNQGGNASLWQKVNSQAWTSVYSAYSSNGTSNYAYISRIDSDGRQGLGISLTSGLNSITGSFYKTQGVIASQPSMVQANLILNYTSLISGTDQNNTRTIFTLSTTGQPAFSVSSTLANLSGTDNSTSCLSALGRIFAVDISKRILIWTRANAGTNEARAFWSYLIASSAVKESQQMSHSMGPYALQASANTTVFDWRFPAWSFNQYDSSPANLLVLTADRSWYTYGITTPALIDWMSSITFHSNTATVSGIVTSNSSPVEGCTVFIHTTNDLQNVLSASTNASGLFSTTWFDKNVPLFAHVLSGSVSGGRSINGTAE